MQKGDARRKIVAVQRVLVPAQARDKPGGRADRDLVLCVQTPQPLLAGDRSDHRVARTGEAVVGAPDQAAVVAPIVALLLHLNVVGLVVAVPQVRLCLPNGVDEKARRQGVGRLVLLVGRRREMALVARVFQAEVRR